MRRISDEGKTTSPRLVLASVNSNPLTSGVVTKAPELTAGWKKGAGGAPDVTFDPRPFTGYPAVVEEALWRRAAATAATAAARTRAVAP